LEAVVETDEPVVIPEDPVVDPTETEVVDEQGETDETIVEEEVVEEETIAEEDIIEVSDLTPAEQSEADLEIVETVTVEPQPEVEEPEEANSGMLSTILIIAGAIVVFAGLTFATIKAFQHKKGQQQSIVTSPPVRTPVQDKNKNKDQNKVQAETDIENGTPDVRAFDTQNASSQKLKN